jgi:hypothetical protein
MSQVVPRCPKYRTSEASSHECVNNSVQLIPNGFAVIHIRSTAKGITQCCVTPPHPWGVHVQLSKPKVCNSVFIPTKVLVNIYFIYEDQITRPLSDINGQVVTGRNVAL